MDDYLKQLTYIITNGAMDNEGGFGADKIFVINPSTSGTIVLETVFGDNNPIRLRSYLRNNSIPMRVLR